MSQAAFVEDYDSEGSAVKPGSRVHARRRSGSVKPAKIVHRPAKPTSDSGYSSHSGAPVQGATSSHAQDVVTVTRDYPTAPSPPKSKPIIHRNDSRNTRPQAPSRPVSVSATACSDPKCGHPACSSARNRERRYTVPAVDQNMQYAAYNQQQAAQRQQPQATYSHAPPVQAVPAVAVPSRPQLMISARARPASMYGVGGLTYTPVHQGPPPSPSAYQNMPYYQSYQQQPSHYGSTPPTPMTSYLPTSPVLPNPAIPNYAAPPVLARTYSTRAVDPIPAYSPTKPSTRAGGSKSLSARQHIPGAYQDSDSTASESDSDSGSSSYSEEDEREHRRRARKDTKRMPPPPRRPSLSQRRRTTEIVSPKSRPIERRSRSDVADNQVDYERISRPHASRTRTDSSYSARSRRPSISTTASSGRTPATTISEGSQKVIVEDRLGRRVAYLPKDVRDDLIRRHEQHKLEERDLKDRIEQYQNTVRGGQAEELTAANIDRMKKAEYRTSGSHVSGHSIKSSRSSKISRTDGIRIETGGTVLHVYGTANVEMQPGEDGGPARLTINASGAGRDSTYGGSKSSGSRQGRSRGGSDIRRSIREEDFGGYEPNIV